VTARAKAVEAKPRRAPAKAAPAKPRVNAKAAKATPSKPRANAKASPAKPRATAKVTPAKAADVKPRTRAKAAPAKGAEAKAPRARARVVEATLTEVTPRARAKRPASPGLAARTQPDITVVDSGDLVLLDQARMQWQFGDWETLAGLSSSAIEAHPARGQIALLVASADVQLGQVDRARARLRDAIAWGCSRQQVARVLIAGVYNRIGRACALLGHDDEHVEQQFRRAVQGVGGDSRLAGRARASTELARLGAAPQGVPRVADALTRHATPLALIPPAARLSSGRDARAKAGDFTVARLAQVELGPAWAANSVNTVIFRHHAVLCDGPYQFTAVYVDPNTMRLVRRDLIDGGVEHATLAGQFTLGDAHNSISLGIDRSGYLHLCYDHHGGPLHYRRSEMPHDISRWSDETVMTGAHEDRVTYPTFIHQHAPDGERRPLLFLYRDGRHNRGHARLKEYDERSRAWTDRAVPVVSGADQRPWTSNPYWNHPATDRQGGLHLSFVWRTHAIGAEGRVNNINVAYARSVDGGVDWVTSRGLPYQLPITPVNVETALGVSPGDNLMNQCSMAADSQCRPHVVFYANDPDGIPQYQHLWFDGRRWLNTVLPTREAGFNLEGGGTLPVPMSRPEVLIDRDDNLLVIYRTDTAANRLVATCLKAPAYEPDMSRTVVLWDEDLGFAEPIVDRVRWQRDGVLTMLIQHNKQVIEDRPVEERKDDTRMPCRLVDFSFEVLP
jgi:hypothetical protein